MPETSRIVTNKRDSSTETNRRHGRHPSQVVQTMLHALHRSNIDRPRARFGCEVVLRFLAPSNPASRVTPQRFGQYLGQPWYVPRGCARAADFALSYMRTHTHKTHVRTHARTRAHTRTRTRLGSSSVNGISKERRALSQAAALSVERTSSA
eukprot:6184414-Pleurochrysis_carterae.AAC.3